MDTVLFAQGLILIWTEFLKILFRVFGEECPDFSKNRVASCFSESLSAIES